MKRFLISALLILAVFSFVYSETGEDILKKIRSEYCGAEKQIKTTEMEQTITVYSGKDKIVTTSKMQRKGEKFRMEITLPSQEGGQPMVTTVLFDGKDTWSLLPFVGKQKLSDKDSKQYEDEKDGNWWESLEDLEYAGDEKVNGEDCYVLVKKEEGVETTRMWLNKAGLYPMKSETALDKDKFTTLYSDVKTIEGYKMPFKYSIYEKEKLMSEVEIKSMKINTELKDELFDPEKLKSEGGDMQDMLKGLMPKF